VSSVYTERLVMVSGLTGLTTYEVPAGKRLVVTNLTALNDQAAASVVYMGVNAVWTAGCALAATVNAIGTWSGKLVGYAGDTLDVEVSGAAAVHVVGYLFDDP
jgi:hypothetical protein